jgi:hypothetical protein
MRSASWWMRVPNEASAMSASSSAASRHSRLVATSIARFGDGTDEPSATCVTAASSARAMCSPSGCSLRTESATSVACSRRLAARPDWPAVACDHDSFSASTRRRASGISAGS